MGRKRSQGGLTMLEVIVAIGIALILGAVSYPAIIRAKKSASLNRCVQNGRQLFLALSLYRAEYDGIDVGTPTEMGLPGLLEISRIGKGLDCLEPSIMDCRSKNGWGIHWAPVDFADAYSDAWWRRYVDKYGSEAILVYDDGHGSTCPPSPYSLNKMIGVNLGGSVLVRTRRVSPAFPIPFFHSY